MIPRFVALLAAAALIAGALQAHAAEDGALQPTPGADSATTTPTRTEAYCDLAKRIVLRYFAEAEQDGFAPGEFLRENHGLLAELQDVAPAQIRPDVETFVDGGATAGTERRLQAFERESCGQ